MQVDLLRAEVARYQARLAELENDFLSLDVVANTEVRPEGSSNSNSNNSMPDEVDSLR